MVRRVYGWRPWRPAVACALIGGLLGGCGSVTAGTTAGPAPRVDAMQAACTPQIVQLPLTANATGGWVISQEGPRFYGVLQHADGTETPGIWTQLPTGGAVSVQDLGPQVGLQYGAAVGASASGVVLTSYSAPSATPAASYLVNGNATTELLGPDGETNVWTSAISSDGTVVGSVFRAGEGWTGAIWSPGAARGRALESPALDQYVVPTFMDDRDDVVGYDATGVTADSAAADVWPRGGNLLPGPVMGPITEPEAVNGSGRLVGGYRTSSGQWDAFSADPDQQPVEVASPPGDDWAVLYGINDQGQSVGVAGKTGGAAQAIYWSGQGVVAALPSLPNASSSAAYGLSDDGTAWGESESGGGYQPVLWTCTAGAVASNGAAERGIPSPENPPSAPVAPLRPPTTPPFKRFAPPGGVTSQGPGGLRSRRER